MQSINIGASIDNMRVINENFTELTGDITDIIDKVTCNTQSIPVGGAGELALAKEIVIRLLQIGESYRYECKHATNINVTFEITYYINSNNLHISLKNDELIYETQHWRLNTLLKNRNLLESIFLKFKEDLYMLNTINA